MTLERCRECKSKVSTEAVSCPSCGVSNPISQKFGKREDKWLKIVIFGTIIFGLIAIIFIRGRPTGYTTEEESLAQKWRMTPEQVRKIEEISEIKCLRCRDAAEKLAKYESKSELGGCSYLPVAAIDQTSNIIVLKGDNLKFQNGFGVWTRVSYTCRYDTSTDTFEDVQVSEQ